MKTLITAFIIGLTSVASVAFAQTAVVYKSPTCGCCSKWEEHLTKNGFKIDSHATSDIDSIKDKNHVPQKVRSCHTALIGGYVIEGHVPAQDVKRLLKEKPTGVVGLAAPGMPEGSPGMETGHFDHYDVVSFDKNGQTKVFSHH